MHLMAYNGVWELVESLNPSVANGFCKTKRNSKCKIERPKAKFVAKGFTQREGIDQHETSSPVPPRTPLGSSWPWQLTLTYIMGLVAYFNLELHQMDVNKVFLNEDLGEEIYMKIKYFKEHGKEHMVYRHERPW